MIKQVQKLIALAENRLFARLATYRILQWMEMGQNHHLIIFFFGAGISLCSTRSLDAA